MSAAMRGKEILSLRTENGKVYQTGPQKYRSVTYLDTIHYRDEKTGEYQLIDNRWIQDGEILHNQENPTLRVELGPGGISLRSTKGAELNWHLEGARPCTPRAEKQEEKEELDRISASAVYEDILPGVDLRCAVSGVHFKDELVFRTPEGAGKTSFLLNVRGLCVKQDQEDILLTDEAGETVFILPAPVCTDSSKEAEPVQLSWIMEETAQADTWHLICRIPEEWLKSAVYPVILDPAVVTYNARCAIEDAYTCSKQPGTTHRGSSSNILRLTQNSSNWGQCLCFFRFSDSVLPALDASDYIVYAEFRVSTAQAGYPTSAFTGTLREVLGSWTPATLTHHNMPSWSDSVLDFSTFSASEGEGHVHTFEVTNLVRKWYDGTNYGLMLKAESNTYAQLRSSAFGQTDVHRPLVIIDYISKAGMEDYLAYEDHSAGRAGIGHVGLFNGNLIFEHGDTATDGNLMPVSVSHVYNSCYNSINPFGTGFGWKLNVQQALRRETITGVLYYVWIDDDGTEVYFAQENNVWKDQLGKELTLTLGSSEATIENKQGLKRIFTLPTAEFNNNWSNAKPLLRIVNALGQQISLSGSGFVKTSLTDGAGRSTALTWTGGSLNSITAPGMNSGLSFEDEGGYLKSITYEDGAQTFCKYNEKHLLSKVKTPDGMTIVYEYTGTKPYRVKGVRISSSQNENGPAVFHHTYAYHDILTVVTDQLSGKKIRYHFNDTGNLVALTDELGYGAFSKYTTSGPLNKPEAVSRLQRSVMNLIWDPLFAGNVWRWPIVEAESITYDTEMKYLGARSLKISRTDDAGTLNAYQTVSLTTGRTYVLSAWCRTDSGAKAKLSAEIAGSSGAVTACGQQETSEGEWKRISLTFTLPSDASSASSASVTVRLHAEGSAGTVWFDGAQLEEGVTAGRLNLIQNSDFRSRDLTGWSTVSGVSSGSVITASTGESTRPAALGEQTFRMTGGGSGSRAELYQDIALSGNKGDVFVAGGWSRAESVPRKGTADRYSMKISFYDGSSWKTGTDCDVLWSEEWSGWHMAAVPIAAPCSYSKIRVMLHYTDNYNAAYFNGLFLHKEQFGQSFSYDSKGNLVSTRDLASLQDYAVYDAYNNLVNYRQAGRPAYVSTRLNYGSTNQERQKHLLKEIIAPLGMKTAYTRDAHGNVTQTKVRHSMLQMTTSAGYSADGNYALTQTDARGQTVTKVIDPNLGTTASVTDPKGQTVHYTYDVLKRVTQTETTADGKSYRNQYTYTQDRLTQVKHNTSDNPSEDVEYNFEYDSLGRATEVRVGTQTLSATAYNPDGTTASVTYENNGQVRYGYDSFKRLTDVSFDDEIGVRCHYTYGNNGEVAQVEDKALGTIIRSEYDLANRPMRKTTADASGEIYAAEVSYDQYNNLQSFKERIAGEDVYETGYEYDSENRPTKVTYSNGVEVQYLYDGLGRLTKRTVIDGTDSQETSYIYVHGAGDSTTQLIRRITQLGERILYTYDEVGNILSVEFPDKRPEEDPAVLSLKTEDEALLYPSSPSDTIACIGLVYDGASAADKPVKDDNGTQVFFGDVEDTVGTTALIGHADARQSNRVSYQYDALGQLVRTNDPFDSTAGVQGTTWVYSYNQGGNILRKAAYPFTEEETVSEAAVHTDTYTYGSAGWKDQLTAYNNVSITYDAIGNPLNDGEWTYTWQHGRQLASMSKDGETVSFVYNEDGLRVQKTSTNTGTTKYTMHGKNIVHLMNGNDELHFFYDAQGRVAVVDYNGESYRYMHNLQGDVIALADMDGNKVVEYWYDAWGRPLSKTGMMADTLGTVQPFRYKGYVWDEEIDFYYLRSRYYRPTWCRFVNADIIVSDNMFAYTHSSPVIKYDLNGTDDKEYTYDDLRTFDFLDGMYLNCTYEGTSENNKQFTILKGSYCLVIKEKKSFNITTYAWYHGTSEVKPGWGIVSVYVHPSMLKNSLDEALLPKTVYSEWKEGAGIIFTILTNFYYKDNIKEKMKSDEFAEYGPYERILRTFQKEKGLAVDGKAGEQTIPHLINVIRDIGPFNGTKPVFSISHFSAFVIPFIFLLIGSFVLFQAGSASADFEGSTIHTSSYEIADDLEYLEIANSFKQKSLEFVYRNWESICPDINIEYLYDLSLNEFHAMRYYEAEKYASLFHEDEAMKAYVFEFSHPLSPSMTKISIVVELTYQRQVKLWGIYYPDVPDIIKVIYSTSFDDVLNSIKYHYEGYVSQKNDRKDDFINIFGSDTIEFSNLLYRPLLTKQGYDHYVWFVDFYQTYNGLYPCMARNEWMTYIVDPYSHEILEADTEFVFSHSIFPFTSMKDTAK